MVITASNAYLRYIYESNANSFGKGTPPTPNKLFGTNQSMSGIDFSQGQTAFAELYSQEISGFYYTTETGSMSVEYQLSNPWVFGWIGGAASRGSPQSGLTPWTWKSETKTIPTGSIEIGTSFDGSNAHKKFGRGVITESFAMKSSIDEPVTVSQGLRWGVETSAESAIPTTIATNIEEQPYTFVHAGITGATNLLTQIQSWDLNLNINAVLLRQMGTSKAVDAYRRLFEITGKVNMSFDNKTAYDKVKARTIDSTNNLVITINNGKSGSNEREIQVTLSGVGFSRHGIPTIAPGEPIFQEFDFQARKMTIVAKDSASTLP